MVPLILIVLLCLTPTLALAQCEGAVATLTVECGGATFDTAGNDVIVGSDCPTGERVFLNYGGSDTVCLGDGPDRVVIVGGHFGALLVDMGAGMDWLDCYREQSAPAVLHGGPGNDTMRVCAGATAFGDSGDDILFVQPRGIPETLDCGEGTDTLVWAGAEDAVISCEQRFP